MRLERRVIAGDPRAAYDARILIIQARDALAAGQRISVAVWPDPPRICAPPPSMPRSPPTTPPRCRIASSAFDRALAATEDDRQAALAAFREVHAMKGAALAVLDEVTAWFCHGLEERLRAAERSDEAARRALAELTALARRPRRDARGPRPRPRDAAHALAAAPPPSLLPSIGPLLPRRAAPRSSSRPSAIASRAASGRPRARRGSPPTMPPCASPPPPSIASSSACASSTRRARRSTKARTSSAA